jgi:preprotein translocase subunit SecG
MGFIIGLLTCVLVLDCLILILLVLIQLPKKDAGAGVAFGGAATDALFGAGSGNVLTKTTKYAAVAFFVMALVLAVLQSHLYHRTSAEFLNELERQRQQAPVLPPASMPSTAVPQTPATPGLTNAINLLIPPLNQTNAPPPQR